MFELFDPKADFCVSQGVSLPHWYQPGVSYFVTFRTKDSMPAEVSTQWRIRRAAWLTLHGIDVTTLDWKAKLNNLPAPILKEYHDIFTEDYLKALDKGYGACVLQRRELSQIVADALLHFDGDRYYMGDFVIMPNHVHLIVCLLGTTEIKAQCTSWKRYTANLIHKKLGTKGRFWQEESFDHLIRSPGQFEKLRDYIANNPAKLPLGSYHLHKRTESSRLTP